MSEHHFWTPARIEVLRDMWQSGWSASQIASHLGGTTRSAVIGKLHRLGMSGRATPTRHKSAKRRPAGGPVTVIARELHTSVVWGRPSKPSLRTLEVEPLPEVVDLPAPLHQRKTIATLTPTCCRWPVGDPQAADFHFCGANKLPGLSYCQAHAQRAYRPVPIRQALQQQSKEREVV